MPCHVMSCHVVSCHQYQSMRQVIVHRQTSGRRPSISLSLSQAHGIEGFGQPTTRRINLHPPLAHEFTLPSLGLDGRSPAHSLHSSPLLHHAQSFFMRGYHTCRSAHSQENCFPRSPENASAQAKIASTRGPSVAKKRAQQA